MGGIDTGNGSSYITQFSWRDSKGIGAVPGLYLYTHKFAHLLAQWAHFQGKNLSRKPDTVYAHTEAQSQLARQPTHHLGLCIRRGRPCLSFCPVSRR